jgi:ferredoxin
MSTDLIELVIDIDGLDDLIERLRADGRLVIGPTVRDGVIVHDEIANASDLPRGWTERQGPGSYRLVETGDDRRFAFSSPSQSWKKFVHPPRSVMIRARRTPGGISIDEPHHDAPAAAFFGIRSCDLAAIRVLDRVLLDPDHPDPIYRSRRADIFVVAAACSDPGETCFCASMNTGPSPTANFDLALTELSTRTGSEYLVRSGSQRGTDLLAVLSGRSTSDADHQAAAVQHDGAVESMGRVLDPTDPPLAALDPEHPRWADVAERCLACGNCTMVCPTCFCTSVEETTSLDGAHSERSRVWDSCFTLDFSHLHGGSTRTSTASRYRQWLLHKLVTWQEQFDMSGCVGCGRCITWCPVGIDLTVEVAALAQKQKANP